MIGWVAPSPRSGNTFFRIVLHRDELPEHLHDLFGAQRENTAAMDLLGYLR